MARSAHLISVNLGKPAIIGRHEGEAVYSSIVKTPVKGPVMARRLNLDGDAQANLKVHGGEEKAVYAYASEHYGFWKRDFPGMEMRWGTFGENFTTQGVLEEDVHIGDRFAIGGGLFEVTRPRFPCFKLGMRFGTQTMVKRFLDSERSGFYMRVLEEGLVESGDAIRRVRLNRGADTVASAVRRVKRGEARSPASGREESPS